MNHQSETFRTGFHQAFFHIRIRWAKALAAPGYYVIEVGKAVVCRVVGLFVGRCLFFLVETRWFQQCSFTLQKTHISPFKVAGMMIFLFHRWDMLVPRRVSYSCCWGCYFP